MVETTEELEPLFDYHRVQPFDMVCIDDLDSSPDSTPKRRKTVSDKVVGKEEKNGKVLIDCDEKEEDDWLLPPPKISNEARNVGEDSTIKQLRLKKQELASFAKSAEEVLRTVEQDVERDFSSMPSAEESVADQPPKPNIERAKIVVSIQDKEGRKQFRVYKDDKLERLFTMYAEKNKLDLQSLVFCFDGDKINPSATPDGLGMEDDDMIEVHIKSR